MKFTVEQIQEVIKEKLPAGLIEPAHDNFGHHYRHVPSGIVFDSVTTQMSGMIDNPQLKVWAARLAVERLTERLRENPTLLESSDIETLQKEAIMVHRDTFEDAGGIGTVGHGAVERYLLYWMETKTQPTDEMLPQFIEGNDSRENAILRSAHEFAKDFYLLPIASELLVCNLVDKYAGTLDGMGAIIIPEKKCTSENKRHDFWNASSSDWRKKVCNTCGYKGNYVLSLLDWKSSNSINKSSYAFQVSAYAKAFMLMTGIKVDKLIIVRLDKSQAKYDVLSVVEPNLSYRAFKLIIKASKLVSDKVVHLAPVIKKERVSIL